MGSMDSLSTTRILTDEYFSGSHILDDLAQKDKKKKNPQV